MDKTRVFLTIDTELAWRHYAAGLCLDEIYARSIEPVGVGIGWQLERLAAHGLQACFFVDPMPAKVFGEEFVARIVAPIRDAGQDVQLHVHPNWADADLQNRAVYAPYEMTSYPFDGQKALIAEARRILMDAGAPPPTAFRAGSYAADDTTLAALAELGIGFDCSYNAGYPTISKIGLSGDNLAPRAYGGVVACPVGVIAERDGQYRTFQICALSVEEVEAALEHAAANRHALVTIVGHSFELATRCGTAINTAHRDRFDWLCGFLANNRERFVTITAPDLVDIPLDHVDGPMPHDTARWLRRQSQQVWINQTIENPQLRSQIELNAARVLPHVEVTSMAWNRWGYPMLESLEAISRGIVL